MGSRVAVLLAWGLLSLGLPGCTRPAPLVVEAIEVDAFEGGEVVAMTPTQLRERFEARLAAAKLRVLESGGALPEGARSVRLRLAAGLSEPDVEAQASVVAVVLELRSPRNVGLDVGLEVTAHQRVQTTSNDVRAIEAAIREALDEALGRCVREAVAVVTMASLPDDALRARLQDSDAASRDAAVRLLVLRRDAAAVPALVARLATDDLDVLRRTLGHLAELRAREAVNPLIEAARHRGDQLQRELLLALGQIGGGDAEAYLDLVATGHEDPLLRRVAEQALVELRRKKPPSSGEDR